MLKKEIISHFFASLAWLIAVSLLRWYLKWDLVWLWLGVLAGTFLLDIDHLIYWFYFRPEKQDSQLAKVLWQKKDFKGLILLLERYHDTHSRLIFHSFLFQIIFLVFTFYIFTSGGNLFVSGLVAGMNLHLLKDEWQEFLGGRKSHLKDWLFWQVKREISSDALIIYLLGVNLIFFFLSILFA